MRWHCAGCGHFHGQERCTAVITEDQDHGAHRCGCTDHKENDQQ